MICMALILLNADHESRGNFKSISEVLQQIVMTIVGEVLDDRITE
jgi:hypothetical protein